MSLVDGQVIEVPGKKKAYNDQSDFFLEDPGVKMSNGSSENVARSLKTGTWKSTIDKCKAASFVLRKAVENPEIADNWLQGLVQKEASMAQPQVAVGKLGAVAAGVRPLVVGAIAMANLPKAAVPRPGGVGPARFPLLQSVQVRPGMVGGVFRPMGARALGSATLARPGMPGAAARPAAAKPGVPRPTGAVRPVTVGGMNFARPAAQGGVRPAKAFGGFGAARPQVGGGIRPGQAAFRPAQVGGARPGGIGAVRPGFPRPVGQIANARATIRPGMAGAIRPLAGARPGMQRKG